MSRANPFSHVVDATAMQSVVTGLANTLAEIEGRRAQANTAEELGAVADVFDTVLAWSDAARARLKQLAPGIAGGAA